MNLQKILDYQKVDMKIYKIQMSLRNSEAGKMLNKASALKMSLIDDVQKYVREADEVVVLVERFRLTYDKVAKEMSDLADVLDTFEEPREIDLYEKKIDQYKKELLNIERELTKLSKKVDECEKKSKESVTNLQKCEQLIKKSKQEIEAMKQDKMAEVKDLMGQLAELKKDISEEVLKKYNDIKKIGKMPVLVQASDDCKSCGGCGMEVSSKETNILDKGELVDCPNCGRILYKIK